MTDKLELIFQKQNELDEMIAEKRGLIYPNHIDPELNPDAYPQILWHWIHQQCIALMVEVGEIHEAAQFKWWKEYNEPIDMDNVRKETIDAFHFLLSLMIKLGMTPDDIVKVYMEKNQENHKRQDGTSQEKDYSQ